VADAVAFDHVFSALEVVGDSIDVGRERRRRDHAERRLVRVCMI
jgi:hypothetical protein